MAVMDSGPLTTAGPGDDVGASLQQGETTLASMRDWHARAVVLIAFSCKGAFSLGGWLMSGQYKLG
jgi:hypothetical protein